MSKALCCEFCGKILKLTINLERHMKTVHLANLLFMSKALCCECCVKILRSTINSERQMITACLSNLSFMSKALGCEFCGKTIQINNPFRKTHENCSFG